MKDKKISVKPISKVDLEAAITQTHQVAMQKVLSSGKNYTVQNSAFEGSNNDYAFIGPGTHVIIALPRDNKGADKTLIPARVAIEVIKIYVQWFAGPDVAKKIKEEDLIILDDNKDKNHDDRIENKSDKAKDIKKSREKKSPEGHEGNTATSGKYKEMNEAIVVPSFASFLLKEAGSDIGGPSIPELPTDDKPDEHSEESVEEPEGETLSEDPAAPGYYIVYEINEAGKQNSSRLAKVKDKFVDFLKGFGIEFSSWNGGKGDVHTIGDLTNQMRTGMDEDKFLEEFNKELKHELHDIGAHVDVQDSKTVAEDCRRQKQTVSGQDIKKILDKKKAVTVVVDKNDKSQKLATKSLFATIFNKAIKGIVNNTFRRVSEKDVILINDYEEDRKIKGAVKYLDKDSDVVNEDLVFDAESNLVDVVTIDDKDSDVADKRKKAARETIYNELSKKLDDDDELKDIFIDTFDGLQYILDAPENGHGSVDLTNVANDLKKQFKTNAGFLIHIYQTLGPNVDLNESIEEMKKKLCESQLFNFIFEQHANKFIDNSTDKNIFAYIKTAMIKFFNRCKVAASSSGESSGEDETSKSLPHLGKGAEYLTNALEPSAIHALVSDDIDLSFSKPKSKHSDDKKHEDASKKGKKKTKKRKTKVHEQELLISEDVSDITGKYMAELFDDDSYIVEDAKTKDSSETKRINIFYLIADENHLIEAQNSDDGKDDEKMSDELKELHSNTYKIKFIMTDPDDPENTSKQSEKAVFTVIDGEYEVDKLNELADDLSEDDPKKHATEIKFYLDAAKSNDEAFKAIPNISELTKSGKSKTGSPIEFKGWTNGDFKDGTIEFKEKDIKDVVADVSNGDADKYMISKSDGISSISLYPIWSNQRKISHSRKMMYIIPTNVVKEKSRYDNQLGKTVD